jgi:branched-chain amino acid transport system substrate-binding protein
MTRIGTGSFLGLALIGLQATMAAAQTQSIASPVKIGIVGPFSGRSAEAGERVGSAVRIAVEEANEAGGLFGKPVEIVIGDDEGQPEKSTIVAQRLIDDAAVLGVIGPMNSGSALAAGSLYQRAHLPFLTPTATNPRITEQGWTVAFRVAGRDDIEGPAAAKFIADDLKPKKVFAISDKTAFQAGIVQEVVRKLKERGVDVIIEEVSDQDRDLAPIITGIKGSGADLVYLGMSAGQSSLLLKQSAQAGVKFTAIGNGSSRERESLIKASGGLAEGVYVTYNARDPRTVPEAKAFIEKFEKRFNKSVSAYEPQAYDATRILLRSIQAAGLKDGKVARSDVVAAIRAQNDYPAIMGLKITFDAKGDIAAAPISVFRVEKDDFVFVRSVTP